MKISVADLKKAIKWIEINSKDTHIVIHTMIPNCITIECKDNRDARVEIRLFDDNMMLPKIRKEDNL